jgi:hypothetical protein
VVSILAVTLLAAGLAGSVGTRAVQASTTLVDCGATGANSSALQPAINSAASGDTLQITGTCYGNFTVSRNLTLIGKAAAPTLDGQNNGSVVTVAGQSSLTLVTVTITDLLITHGNAFHGGGINNNGGRPGDGGVVNLTGSTRVSGNGALSGGGIYNNGGSVNLSDSSSVNANTAEGDGAGIYNYFSSRLTLDGSSTVNANTALQWGGGIFNGQGTVTLNSSSSVSGNKALDGGGIYNGQGIVTLNGSSSVNANKALVHGGGVYNYYYSYLTLNDSSTVNANRALEGAGIYNSYYSHVSLNESSAVNGNKAGENGGGIWTDDGTTVTQSGDSTVKGNKPNNIYTA